MSAEFVSGTHFVVLDNGHETPCWSWIRAKTSNGYGRVHYKGRAWKAHRAVFDRHVGPIAAGLQVHHLCEHRACVNPAHLALVTHAEHCRLSKRVQRNHCAHGHEYTPDNLLIRNGARYCRTCKRASQRRVRARRKAAVA